MSYININIYQYHILKDTAIAYCVLQRGTTDVQKMGTVFEE